MRFIKEMKIEVTSEICDISERGISSDPEITRESAEAFLHLTDEGMLITYSVISEGDKTLTDIEIIDKKVTVKRRGGVVCDFVFEEGRAHSSLYSVGPYSFDAVITARKIRQDIGKEGGTLRLFYGMNIGGAEKSVIMKITLTQP